MSETTPEAAAPLGPVRRAALVLFTIGLVVFLTGGIVLVLLQVVGLIFGNEALVVGTIPGLQQIVTGVAGITGLLAFVMSYFFNWQSNDD